jgi:hypothetical protein
LRACSTIGTPSCASTAGRHPHIEFDKLSEEEATEWLRRRGVADDVGEPRMLASLCAQLEGRDTKRGRNSARSTTTLKAGVVAGEANETS